MCLALGKTGSVVTTIGTAAIGDVRALSICATSLGDVLAVSIGYFSHTFIHR